MNLADIFKLATDLSRWVLPRLPIVGTVAEAAVEIVSAVADSLAEGKSAEEIVASIRMPKSVDTSHDADVDRALASKPQKPV